MMPRRVCCCWIPLQIGCFLVALYCVIGFFYKFSSVHFILEKILEGDENVRVVEKALAGLTTIESLCQLITALAIILGTLTKNAGLLKMSGLSLLLLGTLTLVIAIVIAINFTRSEYFLIFILDFVLLSYFGFVVWGHAREVENEQRPLQLHPEEDV